MKHLIILFCILRTLVTRILQHVKKKKEIHARCYALFREGRRIVQAARAFRLAPVSRNFLFRTDPRRCVSTLMPV